MKLPEQATREFKELYERKFGKSPNSKELETEANDLMTLFSLSQGKQKIF